MIAFLGLALEIEMIIQVLTTIWIHSIKIMLRLQGKTEVILGENGNLEVLMEDSM